MKSCIDNTNGFSFILYSTLVAFVIANNLESEEQSILGIFLSDVGSNLLSIAAYNKYILDKCKGDTDNNSNGIDYPFRPPIF